jgi:tetratricopeptide (TPR) repeat protein
MTGPPGPSVGSLDGSTADEHGDPDRVGRYRIVERVGEGGMGVVYRAYDPELDRDVAVKLLRATSGLDSTQARLLREARLMARLDHPHVVAVHDGGEHEGRVFVAMELVVGQTLRAWLAPERGWRAVLHAFVAAGTGLAAAHELGIVHRDFKPDNVLVDERGRVRVTDFGVALAGSGAVAALVIPGDRSSTVDLGGSATASARVGTPAYMAPEQLEGGAITAATDQFAFCVALWEGLYGERPAADASAAAPPGRRAGPRRLQRALCRGLRSAADERWPSMKALLDELEAIRSVPRRRWVLVVGALGTAAAGGALATAARDASSCERSADGIDDVWHEGRREALSTAFAATALPYADDTARRVGERLDRYAAQWGELRVELCEGHHRGERSDALLDLAMACLDDRRAELEGTLAALGEASDTMVTHAVEVVAGLPALDPCVDATRLHAGPQPPEPELADAVRAGRAALALASARLRAGHFDRAIEQARAVVEGDAAAAHPPLQAEAALVLGRAQSRSAAPEAAPATLEQAHRVATTARHDVVAAEAATALVYVLASRLHRFDDAEPWVGQAQAWLDRLDAAPSLRASLLGHRGLLALERGDVEAGRDLLRAAIEIQQTEDELEPITLASKHNNLGLALERLGDHAGSVQAHTAAPPQGGVHRRARGRGGRVRGGRRGHPVPRRDRRAAAGPSNPCSGARPRDPRARLLAGPRRSRGRPGSGRGPAPFRGLRRCLQGTDVADCSGGGGDDECPWTNDGECDEPEGTGICDEGTDVYDCA